MPQSKLIMFFILVTLIMAEAHAADNRDMFSVKSVGTSNCQYYIQAYQKREKEYLIYAGYIGGYMTAYNKLSYEVFDIIPWQNTDTLLLLLANYCRKNPESNFAVSVTQLIKLLKPEQLSVASDVIDVNTPKGNTRIYQETLLRMQKKLALMGFFKGKVNGQFDKDTQIAIKTFQKTKKLPMTGVPTQATLLHLFFLDDESAN